MKRIYRWGFPSGQAAVVKRLGSALKKAAAHDSHLGGAAMLLKESGEPNPLGLERTALGICPH